MDASGIRVMSFNIRGAFHDAGSAHAWCNRSATNVATIAHSAPDLIGFQELQSGNLQTYRTMLPQYASTLGPRYSNRPPYSFNAIFFDPSRLALLDSGGFWLSRTPERYSASWASRVVRCAAWARFELRSTGLSFIHLNTHLDHVSSLARVEGSALILRKLAQLTERCSGEPPVVLTGDFNCRPGTRTYRNFEEAGFVDTYLAAGNEDTENANTFHAFKGYLYRDARTHLGPRRIDWILLRDPRQRFHAASHTILKENGGTSDVYPSDHYPVLADLSLSG